MRRRHPRSTSPHPLRLAALLAVALLLLALACGRKGDPRPRSEVSSDLAPPAAAVSAPAGR